MKGAKGRIGKVPLNANGRHLCARPIRPRTRSREDHRRPRQDLLTGIPGQRVRHDHSIPSGSRSPDFLFVIVCIDGNSIVSSCSPGEQHPGVTEHPDGTEVSVWAVSSHGNCGGELVL
ncbi:unnamed protein product [Gadus morhua 'NCC']